MVEEPQTGEETRKTGESQVNYHRSSENQKQAYKSSIGLTAARHPIRYRLEVIFQRQETEILLAFFILFSLLLLVAETDAGKVDGKSPAWLVWANKAVLIFFTLEGLARIFTFRRYIFRDLWTIFDLFVVFGDLVLTILDIVLQGMPSIMMVRTVRLLRVFRSSQITKHVPQLNIIVLSLAGAATPLFWGGVMLMLLLVSFGILAVQLINPVIEDMVKHGGFKDCDRCKRAFETVWQSSLTIIQQVIAGDSWGTVCLPVIEHSPWTLIFFALVFIVFAMAIMNIILSHIVDAVMQARQENDKIMARIKKAERSQAKDVIISFCRALDTDGSGQISYREFMRGYHLESSFREALNAMDIRSEDLAAVWGVLDEEQVGEVSYTQFVDQLYRMKYSDVHTIMMVVKSQVAEIRKLLMAEIKALGEQISGAKHDTITTNAEQIQKILRHITALQATQSSVVDLERSRLNPLLAQPPEIREHASNESLDRVLESLSILDMKIQTNTTALVDLITAKPKTWDAEIRSSHELSSRIEGASSRNEEAAQVPRIDIYPPFGMESKGSTLSSNFTTMGSGSTPKRCSQQKVSADTCTSRVEL